MNNEKLLKSLTKKSKVNPNKEALKELLINNGWVGDAYGHFKKDFKSKSGVKTYRMKFQDTSVRLEVKSEYEITLYGGKKQKESNWIKIDGDYYSKFGINDDGSIKVGNRTFKKLEK